MIYPDAGLFFNPRTRGWDLAENVKPSEQINTWVEMVASAVSIVMDDSASPFSGVIAGGCCKVGVGHLQRLRVTCSARGW